MTQERRPFTMSQSKSRAALAAITLLLALITALPLQAATLRRPFEDRATVTIAAGRYLGLECKMPRAGARDAFLDRYLEPAVNREAFLKARKVFLHYGLLKPEVQRRVVETIFPQDYADAAGWWHVATQEQAPGAESWFNLAEWLTGDGMNYNILEYIPENQAYKGPLRKGRVLFIPRDLLKPAFKAPSPAPKGRFALQRPESPTGGLRYGHDADGEYGIYRGQRGDELQSGIIQRFTPYPAGPAASRALSRILRRSGILPPASARVGQEIRIPLDMLAVQYRPAPPGAALEGIAIILDPGHGGTDPGKNHGDVLEDEITYDLVLRIKSELEATTRARVHTTLLDPDQGSTFTAARSFTHDEDEVILTTPNYNPVNTDTAVIMRVFLVNALYREELERGTPPENVFFASIHCDSLPERLSGTMVYIPGAAYRPDVETFNNPFYQSYKEARGHETITITAPEREDAERRGQRFGEILLDTLREHQLTVSASEKPIRNIIIRSASSRFVPGVIRNTKVPTRVLVETANVQNPQDRANIVDPAWRQAYAEAFAEAIRRYFE